VEAVREILAEADHPSVGFMFSLPIGKVYELKKEK
jgi:hypothetical protein